jgi:hypothetical protein
MKTYLEQISLESGEGIALHDITPRLRSSAEPRFKMNPNAAFRDA